MTTFSSLSADSSLTDVLKLFPQNSVRLLDLLNDVMSAEGELSRREREAIAAAISAQNDVPYCVYYHKMFAEVFSGPIETTNERLSPLLEYARHLNDGAASDIESAFDEARMAGWSEKAIYEVVEVCGVFNMINVIVRSAGLAQPDETGAARPAPADLEGAYLDMAANIRQ